MPTARITASPDSTRKGTLGRIYVPITSSEEEDASDISPRSDRKKPNAPGICKENVPSKCAATTPSTADVHSPFYSLSFSSGACGGDRQRSTSKCSKIKTAMVPTSNVPKNAKEQRRAESNEKH